ncbi:unnamed protein product [Protopolystoma xenopodis]|uniref:Uncharacterized protein n=1 Tax=Protopolystoma xenopodis TaxID=117903 RepID=A0A448XJL6_9PLAT|nr:unnamed protein product [Protopolystoma xenopodis]
MRQTDGFGRRAGMWTWLRLLTRNDVKVRLDAETVPRLQRDWHVRRESVHLPHVKQNVNVPSRRWNNLNRAGLSANVLLRDMRKSEDSQAEVWQTNCPHRFTQTHASSLSVPLAVGTTNRGCSRPSWQMILFCSAGSGVRLVEKRGVEQRRSDRPDELERGR